MNFDTTVVRRNGHDRLLTLSVLSIVLAGAILRLYGLDRTSIWSDEAASWAMARLPFWNMIRATLADDHPPLYNIITFVSIRLLGDSETALRLPSAVLGIANIYLIYQLGTVLWDRLTGVFSAALLAFASLHLWHSHEARMYPLLCLTATAFTLATVVFLGRPTRLKACLCGLAGMALLYSHPYGALNWAAINLVVGFALITGSTFTGVNARTWLTIQGVVVLVFLPWAFALLLRVHEVLAEDVWIPFPTIHFLYWMGRAFVGGTAMLFTLLLLVLIALFGSDNGNAPAARGRNAPLQLLRLPSHIFHVVGWQKWLLLGWSVLPFFGGYVLSVVIQPILQDRYVIGSLPPLLLLAARGLWILRSNRFVLAGAVAALVACSVPAVYETVFVEQTEDGRAAVAAFSQRFQSSDGVVFSSPGVSNVFTYYFRAPVAFATIAFHPESDPLEWPGVERVWVFVREGIKFQTAPVLARMGALYRLQESYQFNNFTLYLFARPQLSGLAPTQAGDGQADSPRAGGADPGKADGPGPVPRHAE